MRDLLGKEIREYKPAPTFYCWACAATYSAKCRNCGARYCGNKGHCGEAVCPKCDLLPAKDKP